MGLGAVLWIGGRSCARIAGGMRKDRLSHTAFKVASTVVMLGAKKGSEAISFREGSPPRPSASCSNPAAWARGTCAFSSHPWCAWIGSRSRSELEGSAAGIPGAWLCR